MTASALPPDRLRAMADVLAVHVREINRIIASGMHERDALLAAAQACWEASPGPSAVEALDTVKWWEGVYDGKPLTKAQIIAELHDFDMILSEVPKVYDHVTGGLISKANTSASAVIAAADDRLNAIVEDEIKDRAG